MMSGDNERLTMSDSMTESRAQAQANADHFRCRYYVVRTTAGLRVERERPRDPELVLHEARPAGGLELAYPGGYARWLADDTAPVSVVDAGGRAVGTLLVDGGNYTFRPVPGGALRESSGISADEVLDKAQRKD
jgi:hypothetical protein